MIVFKASNVYNFTSDTANTPKDGDAKPWVYIPLHVGHDSQAAEVEAVGWGHPALPIDFGVPGIFYRARFVYGYSKTPYPALSIHGVLETMGRNEATTAR